VSRAQELRGQQALGQQLTVHCCQVCGARLPLADVVNGRAVHEVLVVGDVWYQSSRFRTLCREHANSAP